MSVLYITYVQHIICILYLPRLHFTQTQIYYLQSLRYPEQAEVKKKFILG